jgi:hypothetical protein
MRIKQQYIREGDIPKPRKRADEGAGSFAAGPLKPNEP